MRRTILAYGVVLAVAALGLEWLEQRYALRVVSIEAYFAVIAVAFMGLGVWLGLRLRRSHEAPPPGPNEAALRALRLTEREREVLGLLAAGHSNKEIARTLDVSPNTVKTHVANLYAKLDVARRTQAVEKARLLALIP